MERDRLPRATVDAVAALAERFSLPQGAALALTELTRLLAHDPMAPTAVRDPRRIVNDHLADALVALDLDVMRLITCAADLGSGAGLPGLPLAIARPDISFILLESNHRKAAFLSRAITVCNLANAIVVAERAESWRDGIGGCDLVTARAVSNLDVVAEYAAPLLRLGGSVVVWRGRRDVEAETRARRAAEVLGLFCHEPQPVHPFPGSLNRHLHVISKVAATPDRFPRRPGIAVKRPLGLGP